VQKKAVIKKYLALVLAAIFLLVAIAPILVGAR